MNCGFGHAKLVRFFAGLDVPQPLHLKTYQRLADRIHGHALECQLDSFQDAVAAVRSHYMAADPTLTDDSDIPIVVSYDGTWHKRGHTSHHGVGVVVELNTGLVIDTHTMSNICHGCKTRAPAKTSPNFELWQKKHQPVCQSNYSGSAPAMEVEAAKVMFRRSISLYKLKYTTVLCDGDAKTIATLNDIAVYEDIIVKEDCVNHVAKRMWKGIDTIKTQLKGTPDAITGKGKVTAVIQKRLSGYYAQALKNNAPDVAAMKRGVYASLFHMVSTDEDPHHRSCPHGATSWCHYNRALATGEPQRSHTPTMKRQHADKLKPVYKRLTDDALLERCTRMKTQNANEAFNGQVWRRCPKTEPTSLRVVETAVAMAVLQWNRGSKGFGLLLEKMDIQPGQCLASHIERSTARRLKMADRQMTPTTMRGRKRRKITKIAHIEQVTEKEGVLYEAGGFNS